MTSRDFVIRPFTAALDAAVMGLDISVTLAGDRPVARAGSPSAERH